VVFANQFIDDLPFEHDDYPVRQLINLILFVRYDNNSQTFARQLSEEGVKLFLSADVDASRRAQRNNDFGIAAQGACKDDLLLIAATKLADCLLE
jgi:hypothetical protein